MEDSYNVMVSDGLQQIPGILNGRIKQIPRNPEGSLLTLGWPNVLHEMPQPRTYVLSLDEFNCTLVHILTIFHQGARGIHLR
jgi:hypothetical protein